jgi:N-dimethylarginine dimethylaminohydrolase
MRHAIVMGRPNFFRIKGGNNPFTRDRWGRRKKVDLQKAIVQWERLRETFKTLGVSVFELPAHVDFPGMVFPANAGFVYPYEGELSQKKFYLSNLAAHRKGEQSLYRVFLASLGLTIKDTPFLFEGEADFFPCGNFYLFTYGKIVPTGFKPHLGFPPYRYQFSHRSDVRNRSFLEQIVEPQLVLPIRLTDVRFYHGDTCLFSFGPKREYVLCYPPAIGPESLELLKKYFGKNLYLLTDRDARLFSANSIQVQTPQGPHLIIPEGISRDLTSLFSKLNLTQTSVDVSEFFQKGGGSIKCMVCDLGPSLV